MFCFSDSELDESNKVCHTNVGHPASSISHEASRRVDLTTPLSHDLIRGSIDIQELADLKSGFVGPISNMISLSLLSFL